MKKHSLFRTVWQINLFGKTSFPCLKIHSLILLFCSVNFVNAQELEALIETALERNPEVQKYELQYGVALEKINEARALPNTDFKFGVPISSPETRTGPQRVQIAAKQRIPWFGVVTARRNYAATLAEAQYEEVAVAKRKLIASVSKSYYELQKLKTKQEILKKQMVLLQTYETLALNAIAIGKASAVDVLKLQIRQNELQQLDKIVEHQYKIEESKCNALLNYDSSHTIEITDALDILEKEQEVMLENLVLHPELLRYDKLFQSIEQSELLHQKEQKPDIAFGLDYALVQEGPITTFNDNGKDILIPSVSLSFPIFNTKHSSKVRQNALKRKALQAEKEERKNVLETLLEQAIHHRMIARIGHETAVKNIKQAKDAETILLKKYETETIDFNAIIEIQELQLKFQLLKIQRIADYYIQTTIIDYLTQQ
ncbi:TolC family protein [Spongiimicrobium salis]|uniref:TolC family protein n=1 Tax=Spongiimicrobium salis TaxID=1667022 RepID=UPI00374D16C1